ncbi:protein c-Fos-like isoform X1 [Glandiceps talaboti]
MASNSHQQTTTHTGSEDTTGQQGINLQGIYGFKCTSGDAAAVGEWVQPETSGLRLTIDMSSLTRNAQAAEEDRRQKRREQNKMAATRYRNRKRESSDSLTKIIEDLQDANIALKAKLRLMEDRREYWVHAIKNIKTCCPVCHDANTEVEEENDNSYHHCQQSCMEQSEPLCLATSTRLH